MKEFFDANGMLKIDQFIMERESFRAIMEDGVVTDEEVKIQGDLVVSLLKQLEDKLDPEEKQLVIDTICEFCVLQSLYAKNSMDDMERR